MKTFTPFKNREPKDLWDAITHYNFPYQNVRDSAQGFLMDYFINELIEKYNEENNENYEWFPFTDKFMQFAHDYLDLLFKHDE